MGKAKIVIRISKEDRRAKPRAGVNPSKPHRDKSRYKRKLKHPKQTQ